MTARPIALALLVSTVSLSALPAFAAGTKQVTLSQTSIGKWKQNRQAKAQAKTEWKAFLAQNPAAVVHARGVRSAMPLVMRSAGVFGGITGLKYSAIGLVGYAFSGLRPAAALFWGGLAAGSAATWTGFKLASIYKRQLNTEMVRFAIERGATVSQDQMLRWADIGKISIATN